MSQPTGPHKERFRFQSQGLAPNALHVVRFTGREGLNTLYAFDITLVSKEPVDTDALLFSQARLEIDRADNKVALFTGYPSSLTQGTQFNGWTFYTLTLQPMCQQLTRLVFNRIHLNKTVQQIIESTLKDDAFLNLDFSFNLQGSYSPQEFTMQWNENVYDYMACKLERDGIYYYFDQQADHEKLVFTDSRFVHPRLPETPPLMYSPTSGLESVHYEEVITSFTLRRTPLPRNVILRDYDWMRPNTPVEAVAQVADNGIGNLYYYGDGFTTEAEGTRLATIRAESLHCRGKQYFGESSVPSFRPGFLFQLEKHYDPAFNREYMITEITHEGSQEGYLSLVLGVTLEHPSDKLYYRNAFVAIPSDVQFRPERVTKRNLVSGVVNAFVDASDSSGKPEIDGYGRYRLVFPQDISGNAKGKASCWVRRAQPYVGAGFGSAFPLGPGVEVLVAFMDGDPDRPFITGAVGNAETRSVDNSGSGEFSGMYTAGGNGLVFNDKDQKQGMTLKAGRSGLFMASGSLDATIQNTDTSMSVCGAIDSQFAGLTQKMSSGFSAKLSSGVKKWTWAKRYPLIIQTLQTITNVGKACDPEDSHAKGWEAAVAAVKSLDLIEDIVDLADTEEQGAYVARLSAKPGKSALKLQSQVTNEGLGEYIAWATINFLASGAVSISEGINTVAKAEKSNAQKVNAYKADVIKKKISKTEIDKILKEALEKKKKEASENDKNLTAIELENIKLDKNEENEALAEKFKSEDLKDADKTDWETFSKKCETELNYTKATAISTASFSSVNTLVGEALALALLVKQRHMTFNAGIKKFGGVAISAPKGNVLVTSAEQVRIASDASLVLQAMPGITKTVRDQDPENLWKEKRKPSRLTLTTESVATNMTTLGNFKSLAGNQKFVARSEITLTNKFDELGADFKNLLTSESSDFHLKVAKNSYEDRENTKTQFSTFTMKNDALLLRNDGHSLKIEQKSPDGKGVTLKIEQDGKRKNTLLFTDDKVTLTSVKSGEVEGALEMKADAVVLSGLKGGKGGTLSLKEQAASISLEASKSMEISASGITLKHTKLEADMSGSLELKAPSCKMEGDTVTLGKGGSKIGISSASVSVTGPMIKLG